MEQHINEMMRPGVQPKQLAVQFVGEPRERMPVAGVPADKRPLQPGPRQSLPHDGIFGDITRVVKVDEIMKPRREVNHHRDQRQQKGHQALRLVELRGQGAGQCGAPGGRGFVRVKFHK